MTTLLETKLQPPRPRPGAVERQRLLDRLGRDGVPRLVLVSAPPGFGKSTLVAQWLAGLDAGTTVAWVSLDAADGDPARFWGYVHAAVERAAPGTGEAAARLLAQGDPDGSLRQLVNGLASLDRELVLVLDDLHAVESREVADGLAFLVEHLPPRAHLVVLTRADPPLPLARLRARGELVEIRAADLRFTPDEAGIYLVDRMQLALDPASVAALEARTEGWVAALQLAALSMRGRAHEDAAAFVAAFAGDDRHLVDYLADEVLERQPDDVREFLLATSVLGRLTGELCDALTGGTGGAARLEALERANLFLIPLDDRRRWYRWHHLFADLLRARLVAVRPHDVAALHRRAGDWWDAHGEPAEAIAHALAAGDTGAAADRIEVAAHELRRTRQEATLRGWLDALPGTVFDARPVLAIAHAGALLASGEARAVDARLSAAERWLPATASVEARAAAEREGMIVRHVSALGHLPGAVAIYRAALARLAGDVDEALRQARIALDATTDEQPLERGAASGMLALAQWADGDLEAAHASWGQAVADLERAGHHADMLGGFLAMADIRIAQGRLADARRAYERGLRLGTASSPPLRGTADMRVGLAELALERDDLAGAQEQLDAAMALGDGLGLPQFGWRSRVALAGVRAAQGDLAAALGLLDDAEAVYTTDFFPPIRPVAAIRARTRLRGGGVADALGWAADAGLSAGDAPSYVREYEHVTLAAALVARALATGRRDDLAPAATLVDALLAAARDGGRLRAVIELSAMRSILASASGDGAAAAAAIDEALASAELEGFVRLLADLGPALVPLLEGATRRPATAAHALRVLAAMTDTGPAAPASQPLVEPLSERELEVLRLLATDLGGPEIASRLFVSLNTMRTHTKHIFAKLGVTSRREAVTRASELGLLSRR